LLAVTTVTRYETQKSSREEILRFSQDSMKQTPKTIKLGSILKKASLNQKIAKTINQLKIIHQESRLLK
jgi:hypothetical protein